MAQNESVNRTPVTLVTGFLGAGKTTLLNRILTSDVGKQFAIVENEFGDLGVDGSLLRSNRDLVFELNDGCICCTVRDDLIQVLTQLRARHDGFDHVIIETTGLAEPAPVLRVFERPEIGKDFILDGVVTVVDAGHFEQSMAEVSTCAEQVSYADVLILNKTDSCSESVQRSIENQLKAINPLAEVLRSTHAHVDIHKLLNIGGRLVNDLRPHDPVHHHHDSDIRSFYVSADGDVNVALLDRWLGQLVRRRDATLLRMKGILAVPDDPRRFVFNGVRDVVDVRPDRHWGSEARSSRIVFIGKGLCHDDLRVGFEACLDDVPSAN